MRTTLLFISILLLTIPLNLCLYREVYAQPQVGRWEAVEALSEAQRAAGLAYGAIVKAEEEGAPVVGLVDKLNQAISLTDRASWELSRGNHEAAYRDAEEASAICEETVRDAELLHAASLQDANNRRMQSLVIIPLVALAAAVSCFFGLRRWRRYKRDRFLRMEIER